ncbi:response regulator [Paraflavitalea sp. CAU 1676]|uniref:response regulator n=1 Tax=Paraflavitalea sp. CAU 1676 TaxID=3032598 RepID=UPI0023DAB571|nr:response regulator [Paraflavitalea sp. CAU 1676]MDF2191570.1 response regulator [Paraflavitalea sp. CAU 1676]
MNTRRLFLVDDDADEQWIFNTALNAVDPTIELSRAANGQDAIRQLASSPSQPDVIFLDLNMPVMNGLECLRQLKSNPGLSGIPTIMYSTTADPQTISQSRAMGAEDFITKPYNFEELVDALRVVLSRIVA